MDFRRIAEIRMFLKTKTKKQLLTSFSEICSRKISWRSCNLEPFVILTRQAYQISRKAEDIPSKSKRFLKTRLGSTAWIIGSIMAKKNG